MLKFDNVTDMLRLLGIPYSVQSVGVSGFTAYIPNYAHIRLSIYVGPEEASVQEHPRHEHGDARRIDSVRELRTWLEKNQRRWNSWPTISDSFACRGCEVESVQTVHELTMVEAFAPNGTLLHLLVDDRSWQGKLSWQDEDENGELVPCTNTFEDEWALRDFLRENWPIARSPHRDRQEDFDYSFHEHSEQYQTPWMFSRRMYLHGRMDGESVFVGTGMTHASCPAQAFRAWYWLRKLTMSGIWKPVAEAIINQSVLLHTNAMVNHRLEKPYQPNPSPLRFHVLEHLRELRGVTGGILKPFEEAEKQREDKWRVEFYDQLIATYDWDGLKKDLTTGEADEDDGVVRIFLGKVHDLQPSEVYYTAWANSNVTPAEAHKDEIFWEAFTDVLKDTLGDGVWSEAGEGDPTDLFLCQVHPDHAIKVED